MRMMTAIHMATLLTYSTCNFPFTHDPSCPWILKETAFLHLKLPRKLQPLSFFMGFAMDHPCFCNLEYELVVYSKRNLKRTDFMVDTAIAKAIATVLNGSRR